MRCLIIRHCAFGDAIHASHLPRLLSEQGYEVDVNTNFKGYQIFVNNPFIKNLKVDSVEGWPSWCVEKHWQVISEGYDKVVNLYGSIEHGLLSMESDNVYFMSQKVRDARYAGINYYDQSTIAAGYPDLCGKYQGEMFFTEEETKIVENWINLPKFLCKKLVMINLSGTGPHKRMVQAQEVANKILLQNKDVHIITTGSSECSDKDFNIPGLTTSITGRFPFRQAALITKFMDCVIGCESGLMCAASMWKVPVVQLMTATSVLAHCKYNHNDFSLQSPAKCSPCYKGPYGYFGCPSKNGDPICVNFDINQVVAQIERALDVSNITV